MAELNEGEFSLLSLEDELTCSICLSAFDCPVTIPCGHNFCQSCLLTIWTDSYSCPQCRTHFPTKPELKKNTVLTNVVQTLKMKQIRAEDSQGQEVQVQTRDAIRCDTCMEAEASQTCFTCMASFCEEHLRPHRENPIFRLHQLGEPVSDLSERICPDHHKLFELFCVQHDRLICSFCLQQTHKGCSFVTTEERRDVKESDLRSKLGVLDGKIAKNENCVSQMRDMQSKLKDSATSKKSALAGAYQQIRDMLAQDERDALSAVDCELESGQTKLRGFMKKFTDNIDKMNKAKNDIDSLLGQARSLTFLEASFDLPAATKHEPHVPRLSLDSKNVMAAQAFAEDLKTYLTEVRKQPFGARGPMAGERAAAVHAGIFQTGESIVNTEGRRPLMSETPGFHVFPPHMPRPHREPEFVGLPAFLKFPRFPNPGFPPPPKAGPKKKVQQQTKKPPQSLKVNKNHAWSMENLLDFTAKPGGSPTAEKPKEKPMERPENSVIPPNLTSAEKRNDLLRYSTVLTLDPRTAHKRITLTEAFTKAHVSDDPADYPDCPERFTVCSQVLASKGFSRGRHYWEVKLSSNNFLGIGLAYGSIDRKGPTSRLGRNPQSWCIEWFNVRLSAWHNSAETVLDNPNPKRVGVLVDCEEGMATFYSVADRAYPFHCFVFPFTEAVFPAFWIFSSGSSINLCKLQP